MFLAKKVLKGTSPEPFLSIIEMEHLFNRDVHPLRQCWNTPKYEDNIMQPSAEKLIP
jgi:hypothetical protein